MSNNKAREVNNPIIKQLIDETSPEELDKIDTQMTNNKQQTAVEFYLDKVFDIIGDAILDKLSIEQINKIHDLSLQAKEMEKEQIITAFWNGDNTDCTSEQNVKDFAEQYYEQTYGGGDQ